LSKAIPAASKYLKKSIRIFRWSISANANKTNFIWAKICALANWRWL